MPRFQTITCRARFVYSPYTADEMQGFGQVLADTIRAHPERAEHLRPSGGAPEERGRHIGPDAEHASGSIKPESEDAPSAP